MSRNKRDRPGKRGSLKSKLSNVLIIVLAIAAFGAAVSMSSWFDVGSSGSTGTTVKPAPDSSVTVPPESDSGTETPGEDETDNAIVLPNEGTLINNNITTIEPFGPSSSSTKDYFVYADDHIQYNNPDGVSLTGSEFTSILLAPEAEPYIDGITMADYSHIKIELDIMNLMTDDTLGCFFYLVGRQEDNTGKRSDASVITINALQDVEEDARLSITLNNGETYISGTRRITYLIEVNQEAPELSRLQVYLSGEDSDEPCVDTLGSTTLFDATDIVKLSEIRFMGFNSLTNESTLGFESINVTVYNDETT